MTGIGRRLSLGLGTLLNEALTGLFSAPSRTFLTATGTWLGALTAVAAVGISTTSASQVSDSFDAYAQTQVSIRTTGPTQAMGGLDWGDASRVEGLDGVIAATALGDLSVRATAAQLISSELEFTGARVVATDENVHVTLELGDWRGRVLDTGFRSRGDAVAVVGRVAADLMGLAPPYGQQTILIDGHRVTVLGVYSASPRLPQAIEQVLVPWTWAEAAGLSPEVHQLVARTRVGAANTIADRVASVVDPFQPDRVLVSAPPTVDQLRARVTSDINLFVVMTATGAIVVGSFGIAHASFVGVLRRRGEFALRQSLGMTSRDIALLVLVEGSLVGLVAGTAGSACGIIVVVVAAAAQEWTPLLETSWAVATILLTTILGVLMSIYPARRASRVQPAEGLRHL